MKKILICLLLFVLLCTMVSCAFDTKQQGRITFYYIQNPEDFDGNSAIVVPFYPPTNDKNKELAEILATYIKGPSNNSCSTPFPDGTEIEEIIVSRSTAEITLNSQFATITDVDFTVACACLTKTVIGLTGVNTVQVQVNGAQLLGKDSLSFNLNSFSYFDITPANPN